VSAKGSGGGDECPDVCVGGRGGCVLLDQLDEVLHHTLVKVLACVVKTLAAGRGGGECLQLLSGGCLGEAL
jgi:hypothetical protein